VVSTVTGRRKAPAVDKQPIDMELIADSTDAALRMKLSTSTRESIDIRTTAVIEQLNRLLRMDLGADEDPDIRQLVRRANKLLELGQRAAAAVRRQVNLAGQPAA
jgi:hypothetical protein